MHFPTKKEKDRKSVVCRAKTHQAILIARRKETLLPFVRSALDWKHALPNVAPQSIRDSVCIAKPAPENACFVGGTYMGLCARRRRKRFDKPQSREDTGSIETDPERVKAATLGSWFFAAQPK